MTEEARSAATPPRKNEATTTTEATMQSIRLEPELENDGTRYAWRLVVEFSPDWQDAVLEIGSQGGRFSVYVPDDWVEGMAIPEVTPDA